MPLEEAFTQRVDIKGWIASGADPAHLAITPPAGFHSDDAMMIRRQAPAQI